MSRAPWVLTLLIAFLALLAVGCETPETPTIQPEKVTVTSATKEGLGIDVALQVTNPNSIGLSVRKMKAKVILDGTTELGTVDVPSKISLPKKSTTRVVIPAKVGWGAAAAVALAAANRPTIPFTVTGTANVGGDNLNVDVPFTVNGELTRDQLMQAATSMIPNIPGLGF
jgi:LEA14-like dessication related protein